MARVEISLNETGTLKVVQHFDPRPLLRRLWPDVLDRHRVAKWLNCNCSSPSVPDATFNRRLMFFFFFTLSCAVLKLMIWGHVFTYETISWIFIIGQTWPFGPGKKGTILLVIFAAVVVVGVFVKKTPKKNTGSAPQRELNVQKISALVQQV